MEQPDTLEHIRKKIRALLSKTAARGCTEAEALAAAEKAAALMIEYGLSNSDLNIDETGSKAKGKGQAQRNRIWCVIGYCTNTAVLISPDYRDCTVSFVGREPGPEIADYLRRVCDGAINREVAYFKKSSFYRRRRSMATKRQAVYDFSNAMVARLSNRLIDIFGPQADEKALKEACKALAERHGRLSTVSRQERKDLRFSEAAMAGIVAGDGVNLSHGVNGGKSLNLIGNAS